MSPALEQQVYTEAHEVVTYLMKTYNTTQKVFLLGHWELDWQVMRYTYTTPNVRYPRVVVAGLQQYLNTLQRAVDDVKQELAGAVSGVEVYHYAEVRFQLLMM